MKANELKIGMNVLREGIHGLIIGKTPRTVTVKFPISTCKYTCLKDCTVSEMGLSIKSK